MLASTAISSLYTLLVYRKAYNTKNHMPQTLTAMFGGGEASSVRCNHSKSRKWKCGSHYHPKTFFLQAEFCTDAAISASQLTVASSVGVEWHSSRNSRNFMIAASWPPTPQSLNYVLFKLMGLVNPWFLPPAMAKSSHNRWHSLTHSREWCSSQPFPALPRIA